MVGRRRVRTAAAMVACLVLGASALVAASSAAQAETVAPEVNDCLEVAEDSFWQYDTPISVVDCAEPHNAEVYATVAYPDDAGAPSTIADKVWELFGGDCTQGPAFAWLGASTKTRMPLRLYTMPRLPTDEEWEAGARWVVCAAARPASGSNVETLTGTMPELFKSLPLLDWVNCVKGTPKSGKWASWTPCTSKTKWLVIEGVQVKGKVTGSYPKDLQAKGDAMCAKVAKKYLKPGAKTAPIAGLGPKKDFPQGDPFADCFIALAEWNGKTG